ncbi:hypothetical protein G3M48_009565 [Beauveria asiatica]|uniref:Uncharacterized protein n=1 Tax=Beauveria asiatica TaxID=1069075 RepID=A0AAW0S324_9HYPO
MRRYGHSFEDRLLPRRSEAKPSAETAQEPTIGILETANKATGKTEALQHQHMSEKMMIQKPTAVGGKTDKALRRHSCLPLNTLQGKKS